VRVGGRLVLRDPCLRPRLGRVIIDLREVGPSFLPGLDQLVPDHPPFKRAEGGKVNLLWYSVNSQVKSEEGLTSQRDVVVRVR
jgi:hypothetical protein